MTIRNILVPVADRPECAVALKAAFDLAKVLDANVTGAHIRRHADDDVALPAAMVKELDGLEAQASTLFARLAADNGLETVNAPRTKGASARFKQLKGQPDILLPIVGQMADLIVVSRPKTRKKGTARMIMEGALLHTARPTMILPQSGKGFCASHVVVAWDRSPIAARAVKMGMDLLAKADKVTILEITDELKAGPKAKDLVEYLKWHGIKAETASVKPKGKVSNQIEDEVKNLKADMLLMGAYTRNRFSEIIFGGVSDHMIYDAKIPVILVR